MTDFTITQVDFDRLLDQNDEEQAVRLFCLNNYFTAGQTG